MKKNYKNIILPGLSIFILVVAIEIFFRFFYTETDNVAITLSDKKWLKKYCKYNNDGFRDEKDFKKQKSKGIFRVGILGNSYVFGSGIKNKDARFSNILEKEITDRYKIKCEVYNMSRGGWNVLDEREYFIREGSQYKFDALVLCCVEIRDFASSLFFPIDQNWKFSLNPIKKYLISRSYAFSFFYAQLYKIQYLYHIRSSNFINRLNDLILDNNNWQKYLNYIMDIKNECKKNGTEFYLVSLNSLGWSDNKNYGMITTRFQKLFKNYFDIYNIKNIF